MRDPTERWISLLVLLIVLMPMLACAPGLAGQDNLIIQPSWQCPTATPEPTRIVGYQPTATPDGSNVTPDPNTTAEPISSTPMPTATPYVRQSGDYFLGQRIAVGNVLTLRVTAARTAPGPTADQVYHLVDIEIDNISGGDLAILFDLSLLRSIKRTDGRIVQDGWFHDADDAAAVGVNPTHDPAFDQAADGTWIGGYPPGVTRRTLVYRAPAGEAQVWGMTFKDSDSRRDQTAGDGQVWVVLKADPNCSDPGGGATDGGPLPPAGTPSTGTGTWPVPPDTVITRGYGCHSWYTGVRGSGCPASAPWWHDGVDFAAPVGTPLYATMPMEVVYAGRDSSTMDCSWLAPENDPPRNGFGNYVKLQDDRGYVFFFGHVNRWRVSAGDQVTAGQQIADMGKTGCSTGSHLHLRVRLNGVDRNPLEVISK